MLFVATSQYRHTIALIPVLCLAALAARLPAQTPEQRPHQQARALTQFAYDSWDDRQGLPQNSVQAITQASDGYLWVGTQHGVARFDGVRFQVFDGTNVPALQRSYVWALAPAANGGVWIGSEEGGLVHLNRGRATAYTKANGLPSDWVMALHSDRTGNLWIGTIGGGLVRRDASGSFQRIGTPPNFIGKSVLAIGEDERGDVYVGYGAGLTRFRNGRLEVVQIAAHPTPVFGIARRPGGGVYVASPEGVTLVHDDVARLIIPAAQLPGSYPRQIAVDEEGALWIGSASGVARYVDGKVMTFPAGSGPQYSTASLHIDEEGSVWVGQDGGGLARMRETPVVALGKPEGLPHDVVFPILQDRTGAVWVGTGGGGLSHIKDGRVTNYTAQSGQLGDNNVAALTEGPDGSIWVGTFNGVTRFANGGAARSEHLPRFDRQFVRMILFDREGTMWTGSHAGLRNDRTGRLYTTDDGLADNLVLTGLVDHRGVLWIGTSHGLSRLENGRFRTFSSRDGLPNHSVMALHEDAAGTLWIATMSGLARLRDDRIETFTTANGLCADELASIVDDVDGRLWLGSNQGIFSVDPRKLGKERITCRMLDRTAGMRAREASGGVNPSAMRAADGRLWFGTVRGIAIVDPHNLSSRVAVPRIAIEEVLAQGRRYDNIPSRLPAGVRSMEIHFTALSFVSPERMRFRYKLDGFDTEWSEAGARRTAYYSHLRPGHYAFRVQAANAEGVWNEAGAVTRFAIAPLFWETWLFRGGMVLLALQVIFVIYRIRVRHLQRRENELLSLVDERGRAEARYRDLFENAADAVLTTDLDGNITAMNRQAEILTGYDCNEILSMNLSALLPEDVDSGRVRAQWLGGRADGRHRINIINKAGEAVPVEVSTRIVWENGFAVGTQAIARDVRDRTALERQLRQSQKMEAVGQLAGGVAHDFNNLLTVIRGNGELLLMDMMHDNPAREDVEQINLAADRAGALTRQLLAFSRKQVVHPRSLDINDMLRELHKMLQRLIGEDLTLMTLPCADPAHVLADPGQLEQVLMNLVVNARDAMPRGGVITIESRIIEVGDGATAPVQTSSGRAVVLTVSDTGIGMTPDVQTHVFEPFFTTKEPGKGTGLGLSTVFSIVQQAGGHITCTSVPGKGTTFTIYLPYSNEAELERMLESTPETPEMGHETILLVEDEDAVRMLAARVLRHQGYRVLETRHGQDALAAAHEHLGTINLLLSDVVLPAMNGRVLAERLSEHRPEMRVLLMSGYTDDEIIRRGLFQPGVAFLQKPFTPQRLLRAVRSTLDVGLVCGDD